MAPGEVKIEAMPPPHKAGRVEDPRIYLAAERHFLAWVRTSLALMGFGFLIARFGLLIRETEAVVQMPEHSHRPTISPWLGFTMICFGVVVCLVSALHYRGTSGAGSRHGEPVREYENPPGHGRDPGAGRPGDGGRYLQSARPFSCEYPTMSRMALSFRKGLGRKWLQTI